MKNNKPDTGYYNNESKDIKIQPLIQQNITYNNKIQLLSMQPAMKVNQYARKL